MESTHPLSRTALWPEPKRERHSHSEQPPGSDGRQECLCQGTEKKRAMASALGIHPDKGLDWFPAKMISGHLALDQGNERWN